MNIAVYAPVWEHFYAHYTAAVLVNVYGLTRMEAMSAMVFYCEEKGLKWKVIP